MLGKKPRVCGEESGVTAGGREDAGLRAHLMHLNYSRTFRPGLSPPDLISAARMQSRTPPLQEGNEAHFGSLGGWVGKTAGCGQGVGVTLKPQGCFPQGRTHEWDPGDASKCRRSRGRSAPRQLSAGAPRGP